MEPLVSKRLDVVHVPFDTMDLGVVDARCEGKRMIDIAFFPETCGWNPVSDTPTLWRADGTVLVPWRKTPKSVRRFFAGLRQSPKVVIISPDGYAAPPAGEPIYMGDRHVVRCHPMSNNPDTVRRFLARMIRKLGRNRGTVTVFSRDLSKSRPPAESVMIGLTYSEYDNPFGGSPMPSGWTPFSSASRGVPTPPVEPPESQAEPTP